MALLLSRHPRDQLGFRTIAAEHRELARIDSGCTIFAGLIDAQHRIGVGTSVAGAPAAHARLPRSVSTEISAAPPKESIAFHPAIDMPRKRNCTSSQRTSAAWVICCSSSAVLPLFDRAVHCVKPSKILASTPA